MPSNLPEPKFLSVPEAAKICGVSRNTVFMWVRHNKLYAYKTPGNTNLIRPTDLVKFMTEAGMYVPPSLAEMAAQDDKIVHGGSGEHAKRSGASVKLPGRVLVVDDDPMVRTFLTRILKGKVEVLLTETGYEALHLLTQNHDIDIVLLDLRMPGQHGTDTLKEIRRLSPHSAVIVVSGFANDLPRELLDNGMVDQLIPKPIDTEKLVQSVEAILKTRHPARS